LRRAGVGAPIAELVDGGVAGGGVVSAGAGDALCGGVGDAGGGAALGPAAGRVAKSSGGGGPEITAPFFAPTAVTGGTFSTGREDFFAGVPRRSTGTGVVEAPELSGREAG